MQGNRQQQIAEQRAKEDLKKELATIKAKEQAKEQADKKKKELAEKKSKELKEIGRASCRERV